MSTAAEYLCCIRRMSRNGNDERNEVGSWGDGFKKKNQTGIKISYLFKIHLHLVILYTSSAAKFKNIVWQTYISTVAGIGFDIVVGVAVVREDAVILKLFCWGEYVTKIPLVKHPMLCSSHSQCYLLPGKSINNSAKGAPKRLNSYTIQIKTSWPKIMFECFPRI